MYELSLMEQRIMMCVIAKIDSRKPITNRSYMIDRIEMQRLFGVSISPSLLRDCARSLMMRTIDLRDSNLNKAGHASGTLIYWVSRIQYDNNSLMENIATITTSSVHA